MSENSEYSENSENSENSEYSESQNPRIPQSLSSHLDTIFLAALMGAPGVPKRFIIRA